MNNFVQDFFKSKLKIKQFCKENNLDVEEFCNFITKLGYIVSPKQSGETICKIKSAIEEYKNSKRTHNQIAGKFGISPISLRTVLEKLHLFDNTRSSRKYNEYIFDSIDTEEKAYWLGYIYADGYIYNSKPRADGRVDYNFELCAKGDDKEHIRRFADFIEYENEVKVTKADSKGHTRCRICLSSKHLWETLNNYGCTPNKSLSLQFPQENIFKSKDLVRHFIRGYFDGDGCISYHNKEHTQLSVQILGTYEFLNKILSYAGISTTLYHNHNNPKGATMQIRLSCRKGFDFINYLYYNSSISLQRKFERYCYFCRLYEESYRELQTNIGEGCDVNPEISTETKESVPSYSVETEPEKSE